MIDYPYEGYGYISLEVIIENYIKQKIENNRTIMGAIEHNNKLLQAYSLGVQNVYNEFEELNKKLKLRDFNKLIKRIDALEEVVQEIGFKIIKKSK